MGLHHVHDHRLVVHVVGRAQDRGTEPRILDHPLHRQLAGEVGHVGVELGVDHREVDEPLDPGLARQVEGEHRLGQLVRRDGVEKEECAGAFHRRPHGVDIEEIALNDSDPFGKVGLRRVAYEGADIGAAIGQLADDVAADEAGGACDKDGHVRSLLCGLT